MQVKTFTNYGPRWVDAQTLARGNRGVTWGGDGTEGRNAGVTFHLGNYGVDGARDGDGRATTEAATMGAPESAETNGGYSDGLESGGGIGLAVMRG